jgi:hypothetical protein
MPQHAQDHTRIVSVRVPVDLLQRLADSDQVPGPLSRRVRWRAGAGGALLGGAWRSLAPQVGSSRGPSPASLE